MFNIIEDVLSLKSLIISYELSRRERIDPSWEILEKKILWCAKVGYEIYYYLDVETDFHVLW